MSPSAETKPPEPPLLKRTEAFCACSSQVSVRSKPYFSLRSCRGGVFSSQLPSSARTGTPRTKDPKTTIATPQPTKVCFIPASSRARVHGNGGDSPSSAGHETTPQGVCQGEQKDSTFASEIARG